MPRFVEKHQTKQILGIPDDRMHALRDWLYIEIEDALSARKRLEATWRESLKMYNGVPRLAVRDVPIPNAPNIEITIGAIASDTIYAQAVDLIWNTTPLVTVRAKPKMSDDIETVADAKALQRFINHIATSDEANLRNAAENAILDDVQLGTGILYTPYVQKVKKTKTAKVLSAGPHFYAVPPEDVIVPGGSSQDIQDLALFGLRFYYTGQQLVDSARDNKWNLEGIQPLHAKDWVRTTRETLGKQYDSLNRRGTIFDVIHCYCYFDIDGDGYDEDLFVVWNHSGRAAIYVNYNPTDTRPAEVMIYQKQAHLFYGLGVLQMMAPYEEKLSDVHNYGTLNILLANSRVWVGSEGLPETMKIWPGKYIQTANPKEDLQSLEMADVYSSIWQDQAMTMQLANQRVGINDISQPNKIPGRTPGITAISFMQQVSRRFTPAFDSIKDCIARSLRQACYRYQERLLSGDDKAMVMIYSILGYEDGNRVINVLRKENFDEHVDMELTAASTSVNREADRQNAIMLTNILGQYYQRTIELVMLASNPQTPPEVATVARKVAASAGELIDRTIRTFDQVRDPGTFIIEVTEELNSLEATSQDQAALGQLMQMLGPMLGGGQGQPQLTEGTQGGGGGQ